MVNYIKVIFLVAVMHSAVSVITFLKEPKDDIIVVGKENVTLLCQASTTVVNGSLTIIWQHNGTWIQDYDRKHYSQLADGSFFFMKFLSADVGRFLCAAVVSIQNKKIEQRFSSVALLQAAYLSDNFTYVTPSLSGKYGSTVYLQCITPQSVPLPNVFWQKNGKTLSNYKNDSIIMNKTISNTLEVKNLTFKDVGNYQCCVTNSKFPNQIIKSKHIPIQIKAKRTSPYFILRPSPAIVSKFNKVQLHCIILGDPPPKIFWKKGNTTLNNTIQYTTYPNGTLEVQRVDQSNGGLYSCTGENFFGSIQSIPVMLTVAYIDFDFMENPQSTQVILNTNLTLKCKPPKSYPLKPAVAWYCNYKKLMQNKRVTILLDYSLHVANVSIDDDGEYFCQATNGFTKEARTSRKAKIIIQVLPSIHISSSTYSVILGNALKIPSTVTGIPRPNTTIYKKRVNGTLDRFIQSTTLSIPSVNVSDEGEYVFVAQNHAGRREKSVALTVLVPPYFIVRPTNISSVANSVIIPCQINGSPPPFVYWTFTDFYGMKANLTARRHSVKIESGGLHIVNVSKMWEGWYSCSASNSAGEIDSNAFLKVFVPASVLPMKTTVTVDVHQNINLNCTAFGDPLVSIHWQHNQENLRTNEKYLMRNSSFSQNSILYTISVLSLLNVSIADAGRYTCVGVNKYGVSNKSVFVNVQVYPWLEEFSIIGARENGNSLLINCTAVGSPGILVSLVHNGTIVIQSNNTNRYRKSVVFVARNISSMNSGTYSCIAISEIGKSQRNETIIVKVYPYPPVVVKITQITPTSMQIHWKDTFNGYSTVVRYILEICSNNQSKRVYTNITGTTKRWLVVSLQPYTQYDVQMRAENEIGFSTLSTVYTTTTLSAAPSPVIYLSATSKTSRTIGLTWNHPTTPNGIIKIFAIVYNNENKSFHVTKQSTSYQYLLTNLIPNTLYSIQAKASTLSMNNGYNWGNFSRTIKVKTFQEVPLGIVSSLNVTMVTSHGFLITFLPPGINEVYGNIKAFHIRLNASLHAPATTIYITNITWFSLDNLQAYTAYTIEVAVANEMGAGRYSEAVYVKTLPGIPGIVNSITIHELNETTIKVNWSAPTENGPIQRYILNFTTVLSPSINEFVMNVTNKTTVYLNNLTANTTYFLRILARTSAGEGPNSDPYEFFVSDTFVGLRVWTTASPVGVATTWLDREYLIIIVALASLSSVLLLAFCVICCVRMYFKPFQGQKNVWELNPYYESAKSEIIVGNKFREKRRPSSPTVRLGDLAEEDFIWDDQLVNEIIEGSSMEPDYAVAITPVAKITGKNYDGVEPYQGRNLELSPLVKLKGMSKNKRHPKIPNFQSPTHTPPVTRSDPSKSSTSCAVLRNAKTNSLSSQRMNSVSSSSSERSLQSSTPRTVDTDSTLSSRRVFKQDFNYRRTTSRVNKPTNSLSSSSRSSSTSTPRTKRSNKHSKEGGHYADIAVLPQGDLRRRDYKVQL